MNIIIGGLVCTNYVAQCSVGTVTYYRNDALNDDFCQRDPRFFSKK